MRIRIIVAACLSVGLAGCATSRPEAQAWAPTIDPRGISQARYQEDLAECQELARTAPGTDAHKEAGKAAKKWGIGTAVGLGVLTVATGGIGAIAALPAVAGSAAATVGMGAAAGGIGAHSAAQGKYQGVVSSCLAERGYHVLG